MKPLRYRFKLGTPLASTVNRPLTPLMFDGILGYAWAVQNGLTKTPAEEIKKNLIFPELPIAKIADRCYAASAGFIPAEAKIEPTIFVRHADWKTAVGKHGIGKIAYQVSVGWTQAVQEMYWLTVTPHVDFYVNGNPDEINNLLNVIWDIRYLGSKRGSGYGLITDITIDENVPDLSTWNNGQPTRPIPVSLVGEKPGLTKEWATYYAPYWHMGNAAWCYMPSPKQYIPCNTPTEQIQNHLAGVLQEYQEMLQRIEIAATKKATQKKSNKRR